MKRQLVLLHQALRVMELASRLLRDIHQVEPTNDKDAIAALAECRIAQAHMLVAEALALIEAC